jgi:hypothetical protein
MLFKECNGRARARPVQREGGEPRGVRKFWTRLDKKCEFINDIKAYTSRVELLGGCIRLARQKSEYHQVVTET